MVIGSWHATRRGTQILAHGVNGTCKKLFTMKQSEKTKKDLLFLNSLHGDRLLARDQTRHAVYLRMPLNVIHRRASMRSRPALTDGSAAASALASSTVATR